MSLNDKKIQENNHNSLYNKENTGTAGILENNEPKKAEPEAIFTFLKPENKEPSIGNPEIKVEDGKKIVYKNRLGSPLATGLYVFWRRIWPRCRDEPIWSRVFSLSGRGL